MLDRRRSRGERRKLSDQKSQSDSTQRIPYGHNDSVNIILNQTTVDSDGFSSTPSLAGQTCKKEKNQDRK